MSHAILDEIVDQIRQAAASDERSSAIQTIMRGSQSREDEFAEAIAAMNEEEVLLFEDKTCSIWTCRYHSGVVLAPHEHCMSAHIAVYRGVEVEVFYKREPGRLCHCGNSLVGAGDVVQLDHDAVHAVTADGDGQSHAGQSHVAQSHAIHVYEGPLTQIQRSLFDWVTGEAVEFTMENFHAMARNKADMDEFSDIDGSG